MIDLAVKPRNVLIALKMFGSVLWKQSQKNGRIRNYPSFHAANYDNLFIKLKLFCNYKGFCKLGQDRAK